MAITMPNAIENRSRKVLQLCHLANYCQFIPKYTAIRLIRRNIAETAVDT